MNWFVVLPDAGPAAESVAARLGKAARVDHPSGRPWILTSCPEQLIVGRAGSAAVALLGEHAVSSLDAPAAQLKDHTTRYEFNGSAHLITAIGESVGVRGTATGLRRVFTATVNGIPIASDNAAVLAELLEASVDPARLATRLLFPGAPWPLGWQSVWPAVHAVRPDHLAVLRPAKPPEERRWWNPPEPHLDLAAGGEAVRQALIDATKARPIAGRTVVSHLSGLDSSSICSLAVHEGAEVVALTAAQPDAMDDDVAWASRTVAALNESGHAVKHDVIPADECPLVYDGLLTTGDRFDEPFLYVHNRRRFVHILERGEQYGPSLHLMGFGGDELCAPGPAWLSTMIRQSPLIGWKAVRAAAAKHRMPLTRAARGLVRHRTYADWLRTAAAELDLPKRRELYLGWSTPPLLPGWVTPETFEAVRSELRTAAAADPGLSGDRGLHHNLAAVYAGAQVARGFLQLAAFHGVRASAPFFDDKVLEATLSTRIEARHRPAAYKPLLVEAMRGIVPDPTLGRVTKAETAAAAVLGSRRHRDQIVGAVDDSRLARHGLVDAGRLRAVVAGPIDVQTADRRLEPTLGCELWLRNQEESRVQLGG